MIGLELVWEAYVVLYQLLQGWSVAYVPEVASRKVARFAIARLFQLACIAWETTEGVYAEAGDLAMHQLIRTAWQEGAITLGAPGSTIPVPGEPFLNDLARTYSIVYQFAYLANWSVADRETVAMYIRQYDPEMHDGLWLKLHLAGAGEVMPVLRRAVEAGYDHTCGEQLICAVAHEMWADEVQRQLTWVKYRVS